MTSFKTFLLCFTFLLPFISVAQKNSMVVAKDGSGRFTTVQAAFDALPTNNKKPVLIYVKNGVYKEKMHLDAAKNFVTLKGEDKFNTILTWDDHTGKVSTSGEIINTRTSASIVIKADDFTAENITFQNDAGFTAGQAVGVEVQGDKAVFRNCRIVGNQDILFTSSEKSREYYENCYIEGTTDFIFGSATAWFEHCHIHSKKNSHVTAASTPKEHAYGYVFYDCILTGDTALNRVSLGRPWRPDASVAYIHCFLGQHIMPEGWANWNQTEYFKTARYAEYKSYGPGTNSNQRVTWSKQLTDDELKNYTLSHVLGGWNPKRIQ